MYLVTIDAEHGVVAAPQSEDDLDEATEAALLARGFAWNDDIEAYAHQTATDPGTATLTHFLLADHGHAVITVHNSNNQQP
ncbi:hypothetical protein [Streptomyces sp. NPDC002851]